MVRLPAVRSKVPVGMTWSTAAMDGGAVLRDDEAQGRSVVGVWNEENAHHRVGAIGDEYRLARGDTGLPGNGDCDVRRGTSWASCAGGTISGNWDPIGFLTRWGPDLFWPKEKPDIVPKRQRCLSTAKRHDGILQRVHAGEPQGSGGIV